MVKSVERGVVVGLNESEVTITVSNKTPVALDWVTISGYLSDLTAGVPISGATVDLLLDGAFEASETTDATGYYEFEANFEEGHYSLQARYRGDAQHEADYSMLETVDAWRPTTSITIAVSPTSGTPPLDVTISGKLTRDDTGAGVRNLFINLYRDNVKIDTKPSGAGGAYSFTDRITETGFFNYFTEFEGNLKFQGCEEEGQRLPCTVCGQPIPLTTPGSEVVCQACHSVFETVIV